MLYKNLGKTKEKLSAIGFGTWQLSADVENDIAAMHAAFDKGVNFVDTAEYYGTEPIVGKAIEGKDIFVATKVWPTHFKYDDLKKACNESLKKLGIKTIDLYQLHWPNKKVPIKETMHAMEDLVNEGKIRYIGVSNFSVSEIEEAQSVMKGNEIMSNQAEYSILVRDIEKDILRYCQKEKLTVIAYSPLSRGHLFDDKHKNLVELLGSIGNKYKKSAAQTALNWLISKDGVVAIPKANSTLHAVENADSGNFKLDNADMNAINDFLSGEKNKKQRSMTNAFKPVLTRIPSIGNLGKALEHKRYKK